MLYQVPERIRPQGWPPTLPLPLSKPRTGHLTDAAELARIVSDAEQLYSEMQAALSGARRSVKPFTIPALLDVYRTRPRYARLAERTRRQYDGDLFPALLAWSAAGDDPDVRTLTGVQIEDWLQLYADRPTKARHLRAALSVLLTTAVGLGWVLSNACDSVRLPTAPRPERLLWRPADVEHYCATAEALGWRGGSILVRALWESAGRISDAMVWRVAEHLHDGVLSYSTGKTGERVVAPLSPKLQALLVNRDYFVTDYRDNPYRPVQDDNRLQKDFLKLCNVVVADGGLKLHLRALRHSATTHATEHGASLEMLRSLTGHKTEAMLETVYVQRTLAAAHTVQRLRGIVKT